MQNSSWRGGTPAAGGTMPNHNAKFRSARSMPAWYHQQQQQQARMAVSRPEPPPPPPPPPSEPPPDPDYEVIEFPSQQYMNAAPPAKTNGAAGECCAVLRRSSKTMSISLQPADDARPPCAPAERVCLPGQALACSCSGTVRGCGRRSAAGTRSPLTFCSVLAVCSLPSGAIA
ncbi:hypothetical protein FOCC_FOCC002770, partial [Frankliniella occidentalis]